MDPSSEYADLAAEIFSVLSDPTRVRIILALRRTEEMSVGELAEALGKRPSGVSQHLGRLRMAHMVSTRQDGTSVFYRLTDEHAAALVTESIKQAEHAVANGEVPAHHRVPHP